MGIVTRTAVPNGVLNVATCSYHYALNALIRRDPSLFKQATASKNSRTRIACLLELSRCIGADGPASALGKKGLKELAK